MSTPALCTTGRRARGASASKTRPSRPPTPQQAGCEVTTPPARWGCRLARSSVSESTQAKFLPKSMSFFDSAFVSISTTLLMFPLLKWQELELPLSPCSLLVALLLSVVHGEAEADEPAYCFKHQAPSSPPEGVCRENKLSIYLFNRRGKLFRLHTGITQAGPMLCVKIVFWWVFFSFSAARLQKQLIDGWLLTVIC